MPNKPKLDLVNINASAKLVQIPLISSQDIEQKPNSDDKQGSCMTWVGNLWKLTHNNLNLELVKVNAYAKFDQIPSIRLQDIEQKQNSDNN